MTAKIVARQELPDVPVLPAEPRPRRHAAGLQRKVLAAPVLIFLLLALLVAALNVSLHRQAAATESRAQAKDAIVAAAQLSRLVIDMETGVRGYELTGETAFLQPYDGGRARWPDAVASLERLVAGDAAQQERLAHIDALVTNWQRDVAEPSIRARGDGAPADVSREEAGKQLVDETRALLADFVGAELGLQAQRQAGAAAAVRDGVWLSVGGFALAFLVALGVCVWVTRAIARPVESLARAAQAIGHGVYDGPLPPASQDEIGDLIRAFDGMRRQLHSHAVERDRAELALRASEERFRTIVETALEGIWTLDHEHTITFANRRVAEMLGYPPEELIGRSLFEFLDPAQRELARRSLERRRQGIAENQEVPLSRKDGAEIWMRVAANPLYDHDGEYIGSLAMLTDVTESRRIAAEREQLLQSERSARLELAARTTALEEKTAEQDAFLYTVSHDLKAPLVTIQGMAELLEQDAASRLLADDRFYLQRICDNARRLAQLLDDLLTLSRIGRIDTQRGAVPLTAAVEAVRAGLAEQLGARDGSLRVVTPLPTVWGNESRIVELFTNLVDNAIKYTPADRKPDIRIGAVARGGDAVECWVEDNGIGIPPEHRERVLSLFQRLPEGKALHANGTGVGLAVVARIVQAHGGRIWIEDGAAGGTQMRFTLTAAAPSLGG